MLRYPIMRFKQYVGIVLAAANAATLKIGDLHSHSEAAAVLTNKDTPKISCRAVAPIEIWVEDSLQYELVKPRTLVSQPMWSR
jgi:hypothetical protein